MACQTLQYSIFLFLLYAFYIYISFVLFNFRIVFYNFYLNCTVLHLHFYNFHLFFIISICIVKYFICCKLIFLFSFLLHVLFSCIASELRIVYFRFLRLMIYVTNSFSRHGDDLVSHALYPQLKEVQVILNYPTRRLQLHVQIICLISQEFVIGEQMVHMILSLLRKMQLLTGTIILLVAVCDAKLKFTNLIAKSAGSFMIHMYGTILYFANN